MESLTWKSAMDRPIDWNTVNESIATFDPTRRFLPRKRLERYLSEHREWISEGQFSLGDMLEYLTFQSGSEYVFGTEFMRLFSVNTAKVPSQSMRLPAPWVKKLMFMGLSDMIPLTIMSAIAELHTLVNLVLLENGMTSIFDEWKTKREDLQTKRWIKCLEIYSTHSLKRGYNELSACIPPENIRDGFAMMAITYAYLTGDHCQLIHPSQAELTRLIEFLVFLQGTRHQVESFLYEKELLKDPANFPWTYLAATGDPAVAGVLELFCPSECGKASRVN